MMAIAAALFFLLAPTANAQTGYRIRDKATETSPAELNYFLMDKANYTASKKISLGELTAYVIAATSINNIAGINTAGATDGKILQYSSGTWVVADPQTSGGATTLNDLTDVNGANYKNGKYLRVDSYGNATWEYPFYMGGGEGINVISGGTPYQKNMEFAPWTISTETTPVASSIGFPVSYNNNDARLLTFQQVNQLMLNDQTFMEIEPETSIYMWIDAATAATIDHCSVAVTLMDGQGDQIPIAAGTQGDITLSGTYCTPYFDDINNNTYYFCAYQITSATMYESPTVTVTHTPSGVSKTWQIQYVQTSPGGGGGIGTGNIEDNAITTLKLDEGAVTESKIASGAISESKLSTDVNIQLVKTVTAWPSSVNAGAGIYWKKGEGMRYYYCASAHGCTWQYETSDGTQVCATP